MIMFPRFLGKTYAALLTIVNAHSLCG